MLHENNPVTACSWSQGGFIKQESYLPLQAKAINLVRMKKNNEYQIISFKY